MAALRAILLIILFVPSVCVADTDAQEQARRRVIKLLRSAGLDKELDTKVTISTGNGSVLSISDGGNYFMQYVIVGTDKAADAEVVIDKLITEFYHHYAYLPSFNIYLVYFPGRKK